MNVYPIIVIGCTWTPQHPTVLHARYICSRDALGLKAVGRPSAARDDRVSRILFLFMSMIIPNVMTK